MSTKRKKVKAQAVQEGYVVQDVWTLPRSAEAYDAMCEQIARRTARYCDGDGSAWGSYIGYAYAVTKCIGITRPKNKSQ